MEKQVLVYINRAEQFIGWRKAAPKMPLMLSLPDSVKNVAGMESFIYSTCAPATAGYIILVT